MSVGLVAAAYVAAAILFILSLGGLSKQEKAKRAVWYGIAGMALAVLATVSGRGSRHSGWYPDGRRRRGRRRVVARACR